MFKTTVFTLVGLFSFDQCFCFAQQSASVTVTQVNIQPLTAGNGDEVEVTFRNTSAKRIIAYVIFENAYSGETLVDTVSHQYVSNDPATRGYLPGATWTQSVNFSHPAGKAATRVEAVVDWVLFDDGSEAGPNKSGWSVRTKSEMQGAFRERLRLKRLMDEKGIAAVETELRNTASAAR